MARSDKYPVSWSKSNLRLRTCRNRDMMSWSRSKAVKKSQNLWSDTRWPLCWNPFQVKNHCNLKTILGLKASDAKIMFTLLGWKPSRHYAFLGKSNGYFLVSRPTVNFVSTDANRSRWRHHSNMSKHLKHVKISQLLKISKKHPKI